MEGTGLVDSGIIEIKQRPNFYKKVLTFEILSYSDPRTNINEMFVVLFI